MNKKIILMLLTLLPTFAVAEISVKGNLTTTGKFASAKITKKRTSADCYVFGESDEWSDMGKSEGTSSGEINILNTGQAALDLPMTTPFSAVPRRTIFSSAVAKKTDGTEEVTLSVKDVFTKEFNHIIPKVKCQHYNGYVRTSNSMLKGSIYISYKVPANTWAISVKRSRPSGIFTTEHTALKPILNNTDTIRRNEAIMWVVPGQDLVQEYQLPDFVGGENLGSTKIEFKPIGLSLTPSDITYFLNSVNDNKYSLNMTAADANQFMEYAMGLVRLGTGINSASTNLALAKLDGASQRLFKIANQTSANLVDAPAVKVAAAMAAFQISHAILNEMRVYCQEIGVYLPFTNKTQNISGIKAAGFWLNRSVLWLKDYNYSQLEEFVSQLDNLQKQGISPAKIAKNSKLRSDIRELYTTMLNEMQLESGPMNRAYVDFNRMVQSFPNTQILGVAQADLLVELKSANLAEKALAAAVSKAMSQLTSSNTGSVPYSDIFKRITEMKALRASLVQNLDNSIRLLSIKDMGNTDSITDTISKNMLHQVNVFNENIGVEYFDQIRSEFYSRVAEKNILEIRKCFDIEGVL